MQRQRRTTATATPEVPIATAPQATLKVRRKVKRRRNIGSSSSFCSIDTEEVQSLVLVAIVTAFLTFGVVWLLAQAYTALVVSKAYGGGGNKFVPGHRHHHLHAQRNEHGQHKQQAQEEEAADDDYDVLPWNPIYHIPEAMETVGDRSDEYATLRKEIDQVLPADAQRSLSRLQEITQSYPVLHTYDMTTAMGNSVGAGNDHHSDEVLFVETYDIYNCPDEPPHGYPFEWKLAEEVLASWPVTEVDDIPSQIHQGLCVFDFQTDYEKALRYREAELPFVVINDPDVARTVERWNIPGYLSQMLGKDVMHRAEYNTNSHFLYHQPTRPRRRNNRRHGDYDNNNNNNEPLQDLQGRVAALQRPDVVPEAIRMTYDEWLAKANKTHVGTEEEHWYFRLIGCGYMDTTGGCDMGSSEYVYGVVVGYTKMFRAS